MANLYTADWHLFHANIIKYSKRPHPNTTVMNNAIRDGINEIAKPLDWLYVLGDLGFCNTDVLEDWLHSLNTKNICVIWGNHDKSAKQLAQSRYNPFYWTKDLAEIDDQGQRITLCHYAMRVWNKSHYGAWHLYGHSHGSLPDDPNSLSMDVGVDTNNFKPYTYDDIRRHMGKKTFKPLDHHTGKKYEQSS